ncbi:hypothetical protein CsSME_00052572 [Camellia sinensis var. sinensis]
MVASSPIPHINFSYHTDPLITQDFYIEGGGEGQVYAPTRGIGKGRGHGDCQAIDHDSSAPNKGVSQLSAVSQALPDVVSNISIAPIGDGQPPSPQAEEEIVCAATQDIQRGLWNWGKIGTLGITNIGLGSKSYGAEEDKYDYIEVDTWTFQNVMENKFEGVEALERRPMLVAQAKKWWLEPTFHGPRSCTLAAKVLRLLDVDQLLRIPLVGLSNYLLARADNFWVHVFPLAQKRWLERYASSYTETTHLFAIN